MEGNNAVHPRQLPGEVSTPNSNTPGNSRSEETSAEKKPDPKNVPPGLRPKSTDTLPSRTQQLATPTNIGVASTPTLQAVPREIVFADPKKKVSMSFSEETVGDTAKSEKEVPKHLEKSRRTDRPKKSPEDKPVVIDVVCRRLTIPPGKANDELLITFIRDFNWLADQGNNASAHQQVITASRVLNNCGAAKYEEAFQYLVASGHERANLARGLWKALTLSIRHLVQMTNSACTGYSLSQFFTGARGLLQLQRQLDTLAQTDGGPDYRDDFKNVFEGLNTLATMLPQMLDSILESNEKKEKKAQSSSPHLSTTAR